MGQAIFFNITFSVMETRWICPVDRVSKELPCSTSPASMAEPICGETTPVRRNGEKLRRRRRTRIKSSPPAACPRQNCTSLCKVGAILTLLLLQQCLNLLSSHGKSVCSWCDGSSDRSFMGWTHWAISHSSQCSTTDVTKAVVCAILSVGWCI